MKKKLLTKKAVAIALIGAMLIGVLSGCGTKEADEAGTSAPADSDGAVSGEATSITIPSYMVGENAGAVYFEPAV